MGWEGVVIWAGRGLLYAGKPTCRKAAPSKIDLCMPIHLPGKMTLSEII